MEKTFKDLQDTAYTRGLGIQPLPVIVGGDFKSITQSYVVVDRRPIIVESPLRAVEITFKFYHSLNCHYPQQSARLWILIAKVIFGIQETWQEDLSSDAEILLLSRQLSC